MSIAAVPRVRVSRHQPLAVCIGGVLCLASPLALAVTFVTNCNDAGVGSLRAAVTGAANNDTVDASGLTCSTITLTTGDIVVNQGSLTIQGPTTQRLTITAFNSGTLHHYQNRIFTHTGTGTLTLKSLTMTKGYQSGAASAVGGCVYSKGNVNLYRVGAYLCEASSNGATYGGAIATSGNTFVKYSTISGNTAYTQNASSSGLSEGGGVLAANNFSAKYSTISGNSAIGPSGSSALGIAGGVFSGGNATIRNSTIAGNTAKTNIGGAALLGSTGNTAVISNSTISGNTATTNIIGGLYTRIPAVNIYNSTIVFNQAASTSSGADAVGIAMFGGTAKLESTLVANNTYGPPTMNDDLSAAGVTISGSNNLVRVSSASLPADTIAGRCPILGPLKFNGGLTQTHALFSHSPGVDQGNNTFGSNEDQRGRPGDTNPFPYPRVSGAAADIGAYELQQSEIIFDANFEGCP